MFHKYVKEMNESVNALYRNKQTKRGHSLIFTKKSVTSKELKSIEHLLCTRHFILILNLSSTVISQHRSQTDPFTHARWCHTSSQNPIILRLKVRVFTVAVRSYPTWTSLLFLSFSAFHLCPFTPAALDSLQFFKHSSNVHHWAIILPVPSTWNILVLIYILHVPSLTLDLCLRITLPVMRSLTTLLKRPACPTPTLVLPSHFPYFCPVVTMWSNTNFLIHFVCFLFPST